MRQEGDNRLYDDVVNAFNDVLLNEDIWEPFGFSVFETKETRESGSLMLLECLKDSSPGFLPHFVVLASRF